MEEIEINPAQPIAKIALTPTNEDTSSTTLSWSRTKTSKRSYCDRCKRPKPGACICESLPERSISLSKCRVLVLQHPHERKRKNRTVPLLQLSLSPESIEVAIGRRLGDKTSLNLMQFVHDKKLPLLLLYPSSEAIPLEEALEKIREDHDTTTIVNILVLDGTWKFAREMDRANVKHSQYPENIIRVQLKPILSTEFRPRRFDIRTPPSENHLSTAESIAWAVCQVENDSSLYDTLLKPLDYMVEKWKSFANNNDMKKKQQAPSNGDDNQAQQNMTSQKKLAKRQKKLRGDC
mmetsp:Transcript_25946/g.38331  ORF Transcript_25946/g.38331 Transcript_25946/m.38331 type:complete len:292 (-) Transcript_25946:147-1022(-)